MASNVVIDSTTIASLQSSVATIQQFLNQSQYYYKSNSAAASAQYPFLQSGVTNAMSVFQTTVTVQITAAKQSLQLVKADNPFKNTPIVSALVQCAAAPGAMSVVLTDNSVQNGMSFDIYTSGTIPNNGVSATIHITAISYQ